MTGYYQSGCNEFHNLVIKEITDDSWRDNPYVTLRCRGYRLADIGSNHYSNRRSYPCTVRVYGDLMGYVLNELAVGDNISVIGFSDEALLDGKYRARVTTAEQIYKPDWLYYYNGANL